MNTTARILVPVDGGELEGWVLQRARRLLASPGTHVTLLRVIVPPRARWTDPGFRSDEAHQAVFDAAAARAAELRAAGTDADSLVRFGDPATEILREIEDGSHTLVLMATSARSGLARVLFGSTALRVLHDAPVPLVMMRPPLTPFGAISPAAEHEPAAFGCLLVALDGSDTAEAILPAAGELAHAMGSRLHLLRAVPGGPEEEVHRRLAAEYLERKVEVLRRRGLRTTSEVRTGAATEEILGALKDGEIDSVAMTTHGRTGLARALYGSVAEGVLTHVEAPVLLWRSPRHALAVAPLARQLTT